ncbi:MAG: FtsX-like permease family protein [Betaproteobacteria bacterium]
MNTLSTAIPLAIAYLRERLFATLLNVLLLSLGIATIVALLLTLSQVETRMDRDAAGIDLVVGAKGSPLQLILSSVFQVDIPTGNIPLAAAERISAEPAVRRAIPLALGDSYRSFRIVGTDHAYLDLYGGEIGAGRLWERPMEVVAGAEAAARTGLAPGQKFAGTHGLADGGATHARQPFEVVGILKPTGTVADRLILTGVNSIWAVHATAAHAANDPDDNPHPAGEDKQITALLIQYASPLAAASFPQRVNAVSGLQAASPAMEIARLFAFLGFGITALKLFATVMMLCAGLGIFIGLMNALDDRRADLALLRVLGATRGMVFLTILIQGFALGVAGVILGMLLGHAGAEWIGQTVAQAHRVQLTGMTWVNAEFQVIGAALGLALAAGLFPAWRAYRQSVPELLGGA